jgi:hypothetical protein
MWGKVYNFYSTLSFFTSFDENEGLSLCEETTLDFRNFKVEKDLIGMAFEVLLKTGEDISVKVISHRDHENMIEMNTSFIRNIISDGVKLG